MGIIVNIENTEIEQIFRYVVYRIKFPTGKSYIGCTSLGVSKRISDHICSSTKPNLKHYAVYRAIRKHCQKCINVEILEGYNTQKEMFEAEIRLIKELNTYNGGYNSTTGGEGSSGIKLTPKQKEKMSIAQKQRFSKQEERDNTSAKTKEWYVKNPVRVEELNKKRTKTLRTKELREKISSSIRNHYKNFPETLNRQRQSLINKYKTNPELRYSISESLGGRPIIVNDLNGNHVETFPTLMEASRVLRVSSGNIGSVLKGNRTHTGGYIFKRGTWDEFHKQKSINVVSSTFN